MGSKLDCINVHKPNCIYYDSLRQCTDNCSGFEKVINEAIKEIEIINKEEKPIINKRNR
jgi:hypothetical protein